MHPQVLNHRHPKATNVPRVLRILIQVTNVFAIVFAFISCFKRRWHDPRWPFQIMFILLSAFATQFAILWTSRRANARSDLIFAFFDGGLALVFFILHVIELAVDAVGYRSIRWQVPLIYANFGCLMLAILHATSSLYVFYDVLRRKILASRPIEFICQSCQDHYEAPSPGGKWHSVPEHDISYRDVEQQRQQEVMLKDAIIKVGGEREQEQEASEGDGEADRLLGGK